jgi:hypothetical protein
MVGFGVIALTRGAFTVIDLADFDTLQMTKLHVSGDGKYAVTSDLQYLHRHLCSLRKGHSQQVDHKNRNSLDNRRQNLVVTTNSGNQRNTGLSRNNSTGVKGVCRFRGGRYRAYIHVGPRGHQTYIHLGLYNTLNDAAEARRLAETRHWATEGNQCSAKT